MSVNVPLDELPQALERFGLHPYIVTVGSDGWAAVFDSPETNEVVFVQPGKAVLHVSKG